MKKLLLLIGILVIVVDISFFVFGRQTHIKNYPPKDGPLVAFGDSLVAGYGSTEGHDFVSLLSAQIGEPIINLGVSGDTTADGLKRIDEVLEINPRIVMVLLGGNDFLRKVPREETFATLRTIINRIQESGAIVVVLGVRGGLLSDNADQLFKKVAEETGSAYVPNVLSGLFADGRYMSDAIHPNDAGYARVAEKVLPILQKILK